MTAVTATDLKAIEYLCEAIDSFWEGFSEKIGTASWDDADAYLVDQIDEARYRLYRAYHIAKGDSLD